MVENKDLSELVQELLAQSFRDKRGGVVMNGERPMTAMEAIAMSITQNAMRGDIASILLVKNLTRRPASEEETERILLNNEARLSDLCSAIREELEHDGLYFGQDIDIELTARAQMILERIERLMSAPDYEDVIQEMRKDGSVNMVLNPLHKRWDELTKQLRERRQQLRQDALIRKSQNKK